MMECSIISNKITKLSVSKIRYEILVNTTIYFRKFDKLCLTPDLIVEIILNIDELIEKVIEIFCYKYKHKFKI